MDIMDIVLRLFNVSISASYLVIVIVAFRFIFKKAPKSLSVVLWALVAIRLICPVSFESEFSLIPSAETIPQEILSIDPTKGADYVPVDIITNPAYSEYIRPEVTVATESTQIDIMFASFGWLFGIGAMILYAVISYLRIYLKIRQSLNLRENIFICDSINTPFIFGLIRPRIYLPSDMNEEDMTFVIAHEKAHLKRKDYIWKPLGFLLLTVYWFNPVMWVAYVLLCRDIELACDEKVIKEMGAEIKKPYSMALINCSVPKKMITACPIAFGEVGVKQRIKAVLSYKKPAFWVIVVAVIVSIAVAVCFLTDPKSDEKTLPEKTYLVLTQDGMGTSSFGEALEYTDYFIVRKDDTEYFKASTGSGRSTVLNFLSALNLEESSEAEKDGYNVNGKIEVSNESYGDITIYFADGYSKLWLVSSDGDIYSSVYSIDNPATAEKFFKEAEYISQGPVWEFNLASSAIGYSEIYFYLTEETELVGEVTATNGFIDEVKSEKYGLKGIHWRPEITQLPLSENIKITIPVIDKGKKVDYEVVLTKVGQENLATYYLISAEDVVIGGYGNNHEYLLSLPSSSEDDLQWYYNPSLSSGAYSILYFTLPTDYIIKSVDCSAGTAEITEKYYNEPDGEKCIQWSPEFPSKGVESYDIIINAQKKGEEVLLSLRVTKTEKTDEFCGIIFEIEPLNCTIEKTGWAKYALESEYKETELTLKKDKISKTSNWKTEGLKSAGLKGVEIGEEQDCTFGKVYLFFNDFPSANYRQNFLAVETEDDVFLFDAGESYNTVIKTCDVDGELGEEIVLQRQVGASGGAGSFISSIYKVTEKGINSLFNSSSANQFENGFTSKLEEPFLLKIINSSTKYETTLDFKFKYIYEIFDALGKPVNNEYKAEFDSFYSFVPEDVDGDGIYEIECLQYVSLYGHADYIGTAVSVLKYDEKTDEFKVIDASFFPVYPDDFDIKFTFGIGLKNVYDTYDNILTKDLVADGTKNIDFAPSDEQLYEIYQKIIELDIMSIDKKMTSSVLSTSDERFMIAPLNQFNIQFTVNSETYYVSGDATATYYRETSKEAERFCQFIDFMTELYYATPEYADFPEAKGGYS